MSHLNLALELLELKQGANHSEIKKSFWMMAMKHHPDKNPKDHLAENRFKRIVWAYEYLTKNIDYPPIPEEVLNNSEKLGKYFANEWGYFCWWRDVYF